MKKKFAMAIGLAAMTLNVSGQQTMAEFSICDGAKIEMAGGVENATLGNLCDKNDLTVFEAENATGLEVTVTAAEKWVAKGLVVVAAGDVAEAPQKLALYGRNAGEDWTLLGRFARVKFSGGAYTQYAGKTLASQTAGRSEFKMVVETAGTGDVVKIAEMQILGFPEKDSRNIAVEENGVFTAPDHCDNLWAIGGGSYATPATLKKVKAADGVENAWIDYTFDEPTVISGYGLTSNLTSVQTMRPSVWDVMASEDGENWVTLDMRNNEEWMAVDSYQQRYELPSKGMGIDFAAVSDELHKVMIEKFYRDYWGGKYLVKSWNEDESKIDWGYNYWWMAHAVDACTDALMRTGSRIWQTRASQIKKGMYTAYDAGRQDLWNSYYDDMEWMAIACIRAYESHNTMQDTWLGEAKQLFEWIWGGWSEVGGGGISWNCDGGRDSKNSCSNAPAIIIAARLYQITGEEHYLEKAKMIYEWMLTHSRFDDGFIKDAPGNDNRGWTFSYNQGTWVGGLLELYKITGEEKYREIAVDLMDKSIDGKWYSPRGIMREQGDGDGGLFKGIYIRYITEWVLSGKLDAERQYRYAKYLVENAKSLCQTALVKPDFTVMASWRSRAAQFNGGNNGGPNGNYDSSILLSGLFLLEGVDQMRRAGVLNDDYSVKNENVGRAYKYYRLRVTDNLGGENVQVGAWSLYGEGGDASVDEVTVGEEAFSVDVEGDGITVSGDGEPVMIYNVLGQTVGAGVAGEKIAVEATGVLIVARGNLCVKIVK